MLLLVSTGSTGCGDEKALVQPRIHEGGGGTGASGEGNIPSSAGSSLEAGAGAAGGEASAGGRKAEAGGGRGGGKGGASGGKGGASGGKGGEAGATAGISGGGGESSGGESSGGESSGGESPGDAGEAGRSGGRSGIGGSAPSRDAGAGGDFDGGSGGALDGAAGSPDVNAPCAATSTRTGYQSIRSEADLERLEGVRSIEGGLTVAGLSAATDLRALQCLEVVTGPVVLRGLPLVNLQGLERLRSVGGLTIEDNPSLLTLAGLHNVTSIKDGLSIQRNAQLREIDLHALGTALRYQFVVSNNPRLVTLHGPGYIEHVLDVLIEGNAALTTIAGFERLREVASSLRLSGNPSLSELPRFDALATVGYMLQLRGPSSLRRLGGFENLALVDDTCEISGHAALEDVSGFSRVSDIWQVSVEGNAALTRFEAFGGTAKLRLRIHDAPLLAELDFPFWTSGELELENVGLSGLSGFHALRDGVLRLTNLALLANLNGLDALDRCSVFLTNNPALTSLTGLESCANFGLLEIDGNPALTSLSGLETVQNLGRLRIKRNASLETLEGLGALTAIDLDLGIDSNPMLTSLAGLENLTTVGMLVPPPWEDSGIVDLRNNATLRDLHALAGLGALRRLTVLDNPDLPLCEADWLSQLTDPWTVQIAGNGSGTCPP